MKNPPRTNSAPAQRSAEGPRSGRGRLALQAEQLIKSFPLERSFGRVTARMSAVDGVDLRLEEGTTLGVVGESGSGKSTLARLLAHLVKVDSGTVELFGTPATELNGAQLKQFRSDLQMVFQDPYGALDPTKTVGHAVFEPLLVHGRAKRAQLAAEAGRLLETVSLDARLVDRYPDELSGGQRQRVCIARALALGPRVLVADEPTSALDLSTRSEILNLLMALQARFGLSIVLISHDFATVRHMSHRVAVMYKGRFVEEGPTADVVENPQHPYTRTLLAAVPVPDPAVQRARQQGVPKSARPNELVEPGGCNFKQRCPLAVNACSETDPHLVEVSAEHRAACLVIGAGEREPTTTSHKE